MTTDTSQDNYGLAAIGFQPEAYDTYAGIVSTFDGYGVTLTLKGGEQVEAVLAGVAEYDEDEDVYYTPFFRVTDGDFPTIESVRAKRPEAIERAVVTRIEIH